MNSIDDFARQWNELEKEDVDTISEWVNAVMLLNQNRV